MFIPDLSLNEAKLKSQKRRTSTIRCCYTSLEIIPYVSLSKIFTKLKQHNTTCTCSEDKLLTVSKMSTFQEIFPEYSFNSNLNKETPEFSGAM